MKNFLEQFKSDFAIIGNLLALKWNITIACVKFVFAEFVSVLITENALVKEMVGDDFICFWAMIPVCIRQWINK